MIEQNCKMVRRTKNTNPVQTSVKLQVTEANKQTDRQTA